MLSWRDVQEKAQKITKCTAWKPARMVGLDGAYVLGWGEKQPVLVAVDLGTGAPLALEYLNEQDPQAVRRWLDKALRELQETLPKAGCGS